MKDGTKLSIIIITLFLFGNIYGGVIGYLWPEEEAFGGNVRTQSTGIEIMDGDSLTIGTSTAFYEVEIYDTATPTLRILGDAACDIREDTDSAGYTYCTYLNGAQTCSSTDICN